MKIDFSDDENSHKDKNQRYEKVHKKISWGAIFRGAIFLGGIFPRTLNNYLKHKQSQAATLLVQKEKTIGYSLSKKIAGSEL